VRLSDEGSTHCHHVSIATINDVLSCLQSPYARDHPHWYTGGLLCGSSRFPEWCLLGIIFHRPRYGLADTGTHLYSIQPSGNHLSRCLNAFFKRQTAILIIHDAEFDEKGEVMADGLPYSTDRLQVEAPPIPGRTSPAIRPLVVEG